MASDSQSRVQSVNRRSLVAVVLCFLSVVGCEPKPSNLNNAIDGSAGTASARRILDKVAAAYANAKTYEDVGELHVEATSDGRRQSFPPQEFTTTFERPNRFRLHAMGVSVLSDGELFRAVVPGIEQILTLPAPESLAMDHLQSDKILSEALSGGLPTILPLLRLLVGDKDLPGYGSDANLKELDNARIDDVTYQRVQATTDAGKTTYWIDPKTHLVGRIEFATDAILKKQRGQVESLKIWADFQGARFDHAISKKAFEFEAPPNAQLVKRLLPPPPAPPSPMLGQPVGEFAFDNLSHEGTIDRAAVKGKVAVFDFWATWCVWCFRGLPNLQKVYDKFKDDDQVAIYAVDTDEASIDDEEVKKSFAQAKLHLPIARDRKDYNAETFAAKNLPTMVVLDGNGTIQFVHVGYDPNLEEKLTKVIKSLMAGEDVARKTLEEHELERSKYEQELNEVLIGTTSTVEVPESKIAERSQPSKFNLEPLWTAKDVALPGNLLVIQQPTEAPIIYALSESKKLIQLSPTGEVAAKIDLKIPEKVGVSSLRTATDARGARYFVTFASTQQQLYLFDANWQPLLSYPDSPHSGISDVQMADLDGDGQPEILVGYWGVVGVQGVSLAGERSWSNRQVENVTRLAVSAPADDGKKFALCVNNRDFITPIDYAGKSQPAIPVDGHALYALFVADLDGSPPAELCALRSSEVGVVNVIGLDMKGNSLWTYPLPHGLHTQPIELVTAGTFPSTDGGTQGVWLLAGPDGSIHILGADGNLIDKFDYGEELSGLATTTLDGHPSLIVSSKKSLAAWQIESRKD